MQTSSYIDWMRRPLSSAVCPTPDIWPEEAVPAQATRARVNTVPARAGHARVAAVFHTAGPPVTSEEEFMNDEKLRILKMLEDGKVSADEAARLMEALDKSESRPTESDIRKKWLHIRVQEEGRDKVNMRVPLALLKFGFKLAPKVARQHARNTHRKAERARARAERERERALRRAHKAADKVKRDLSGKLGDHPGVDVDAIVNGAIQESMAEMEEAINEGLAEVSQDIEAHVNGGLASLAGRDFDLDLDSILEMAQSEGFDGKILDVYDEDDDEHVTITLE